MSEKSKTKKKIQPLVPIQEQEPPEQPSVLSMALIVAVVVAIVILVFSGLGYALGKFIF